MKRRRAQAETVATAPEPIPDESRSVSRCCTIVGEGGREFVVRALTVTEEAEYEAGRHELERICRLIRSGTVSPRIVVGHDPGERDFSYFDLRGDELSALAKVIFFLTLQRREDERRERGLAALASARGVRWDQRSTSIH